MLFWGVRMNKYLIVGDIHLKGKNPAKRVDDYYKSIMLKLIEIYKMSSNYDGILLTGDIFGGCNISFSVVYNFKELLKMFKCKVYLIIGNHDVNNGKLDKLKYCGLGLLKDVVTIVGLKAIKIGDGIWLEGCDDVYNIDVDRTSYNFKSKVDDGIRIKLVHGALMPSGQKFFGDYTSIDMIADKVTQEITISGHVHGRFDYEEINNKYFVMAGSICRVSMADKRDIIEIGELVIEGKDIKINKKRLKRVKKYNEVFNIKITQDENYNFIEDLNNEKIEDINDIEIIMNNYLDEDLFKKFKILWEEIK